MQNKLSPPSAPATRKPMSRDLVGAAVAIALVATLGACSSSDNPTSSPSASPESAAQVKPGAGFGPALRDAAPGDEWWITSNNATIEVSGPPSSTIRVSMELVATPCGPADVSVGGQNLTIQSRSEVAVLATTNAAGSAQVPITATSAFCQPRNESRPLYALVSNPVSVVIGPSTEPAAVPLTGFATREGNAPGFGYWMTSPAGVIQVLGKPSSNVNVSLTLMPTPCGPAQVSVGGKKYDVGAATNVTLTSAVSAEGAGSVPIASSSKPCSPGIDTRTLYAMIFTPTASQT